MASVAPPPKDSEFITLMMTKHDLRINETTQKEKTLKC